jgi:hypothetical protein
MLFKYGMYAGLDVGRFVHPSHLAVIVPLEREDAEIPWKARHFVQVASVWLDDVPYTEQVREIKEILAMGGAFVRVFYDNTRGELVALQRARAFAAWLAWDRNHRRAQEGDGAATLARS